MGIIAIIGSVLEVLKEFLQWQSALSAIRARKLAYDIDQMQMAAGRDLRAKIDSARDANDLLGTSVLLDAEFASATFASDIRTTIHNAASKSAGANVTGMVQPANSGNVRVSGGISTGTGTTGRSDNSVEPSKSSKTT